MSDVSEKLNSYVQIIYLHEVDQHIVSMSFCAELWFYVYYLFITIIIITVFSLYRLPLANKRVHIYSTRSSAVAEGPRDVHVIVKFSYVVTEYASNGTTAVRVWRPLTKKSTANQRYAISHWWLILTVTAVLTVCEIFSGVEVENRHFRPLHCDCSPLAEARRTISM